MMNGVIWDLDGTLWDSSEQVYRAWNAYMEKVGLPRRFTAEDVKGYCGKTLEHIALIAFPSFAEKERNELIYGCCDLENIFLERSGGLLYPREREVLSELKACYHMSVVSNCGEGYIEAYLSGHDMWGFFNDRENAAHTGKGKADNIRLVMERNNLQKAVYIGDTQGDKDAADKAGIPFIFASYGFGSAPEAKWCITSLPELPMLLKEIF